MIARTVIALVLALVSATLVNLAYLREHDAAAALPALSLRRPVHSVKLLLGDRSWLKGFAMETGGWLMYVAALALGSLSLVQSVSAGGIGVLAFASARLSKRRLSPRERGGATISLLGLIVLAVSLSGGDARDTRGSVVAIILWLGVTAGVAALVASVGRRFLGAAAADGVAGGLLLSIGDIATKVTTQGGARIAFVVLMLGGYALGTSMLQLGYQRGAALTIAGIATLLTNALPIAAGSTVLDEPLPGGALGTLRLLAFAAVVGGAVLLARPERPDSSTGSEAAVAAQARC